MKEKNVCLRELLQRTLGNRKKVLLEVVDKEGFEDIYIIRNKQEPEYRCEYSELFLKFLLFGNKTYLGVKGGRVSTKTEHLAIATLYHYVNSEVNIGVFRKYQVDVQSGFFNAIKYYIDKLGLGDVLKVYSDTEIVNLASNKVMFFKGMQSHRKSSLKGFFRVDIAILEEASEIDLQPLNYLNKTIRQEGSKLLAVWNPDDPKGDAIDTLFDNNPEVADRTHVNYNQVEYFIKDSKGYSDIMNLLKRIEDLKVSNPTRASVLKEEYEVEYLGLPKVASNELVYYGYWSVSAEIPLNYELSFIGIDWANSGGINAFVYGGIKDAKLYIQSELKVDKATYNNITTKKLIDSYKRWNRFSKPTVIVGDSALGVQNNNFEAAGIKIKGVENKHILGGIALVKSFEDLVVHPSCENVLYELSNYKYTKDNMGNILSSRNPIDADNHFMDAIRYGVVSMLDVNIKKLKMRTIWGNEN